MNKDNTHDLVRSIQIILRIFLISIIIIGIIIGMVVVKNLNDSFPYSLEYNDTYKGKSMLNISNCKWYYIGCQKLACVVDCRAINKNAGEIICVC